MIRLRRERYVTAVKEVSGFQVTVGLSYPALDSGAVLDWLRSSANHIASVAAERRRHEAAVAKAEELIDRWHPNRPFYVETADEDGGTQVFQPYGLPEDGAPRHPEPRTGCQNPDCFQCGGNG